MNVWQIVVQVGIGFALGILASIKIVPWISERQQRRLVKSLLRRWGGDSITAIMRLKPPAAKRMFIEGYEEREDHSDLASDLRITGQLWSDVKEGRRKPDGIAMVIYQALEAALQPEGKKKKAKTPATEEKLPFGEGEPETAQATIKRVLNPMYAKLEIFDLASLPVNEMELALGQLEKAERNGHYTASMYDTYALNLAQAMERFAEYLWRLEGWDGESANG